MPPSTEQRQNMVRLGINLRRARMKYVMGLRELAREEDLSAEYLSAVELGKERASERVIEIYSTRFGMERDELMRLVGRIPTDVRKHLLKSKKNMARIRDEMKRNEKRALREMKKVENG